MNLSGVFRNQELSNSAWAFSKLSDADAGLRRAFSEEVTRRLAGLDPQALANLADSVPELTEEPLGDLFLKGMALRLLRRLEASLEDFVTGMPDRLMDFGRFTTAAREQFRPSRKAMALETVHVRSCRGLEWTTSASRARRGAQRKWLGTCLEAEAALQDGHPRCEPGLQATSAGAHPADLGRWRCTKGVARRV